MQLPPELRDFIIDLLQDDLISLHACSLTCRSWLPRSRHHLFHSVQIEPGRRGAAFKALLDTSPDIGKYVRDLQILGRGQDIPVEHVVKMEWPTLRPGPHPSYPPMDLRRVSWLESILPASTEILQRVSSLTVVALLIHTELVDILSRHFSAITTLELRKCRSATFADFLTLPRAFNEATSVLIYEVQWLRPTLPPTAIAFRPRMLKTLVLSPKTEAALILPYLVPQDDHNTLESLSCHCSGQPSALTIRDLLKAVGTSLRHLSFGFSDVKDPTVILQNTKLNLEACTGLRSLHVYCTNSDRHASMPSLSWILILLSKLNSSNLCELQFSIPASFLPALNLEGLAVVLSHSPQASLKCVIFNVILRGDTIQDVEERIKSRVSSLTAKGLEVEVINADRCPPRLTQRPLREIISTI